MQDALFLDESGGINPGYHEIFIVAGVRMAAQEARRTVSRFRRRFPAWRKPELHGVRMTDEMRRFLLRGALTSAGVSAAAIVADTRMPYVRWASRTLGGG